MNLRKREDPIIIIFYYYKNNTNIIVIIFVTVIINTVKLRSQWFREPNGSIPYSKGL